MKNWRDVVVLPRTSIRDVLAVIDRYSTQIALVADENGKLIGTVTDGDVRRGLLRGVSLEQPVLDICNHNPITARVSDDPAAIRRLMESRKVRHIPVVDTGGRVLRIEFMKPHSAPKDADNPVVLMAGGLGTRLRPLTASCPKPMLEIGGKPILETILDNFRSAGFHRFYIAVNYLAQTIEEHFGDGSRFGVEIDYLREKEKLGTAGALSLLPERPQKTFFVMNADLLTKVDFQGLLNFHHDNKATATMCVREYTFQIPFGVVKMEAHRITGIDEKPAHTFFVNAGIYTLEPEALDHVPVGTPLDMPALFEHLVNDGLATQAFPVFEYWLDVGHMTDFERGQCDFGIHFSPSKDGCL